MPESVFTNKNFSYDKTRKKWRGKLIWRDADNKRHWIVRTFQQSGKRAAYSEFLQWVEEEEEAWRKKLTEGDISEISRMNVPDYVSSFIDSKEGAKVLEPATIKSYRSTVKYISNGLDGVELRELNARMVNDWMADLLSSGLSSLTVGRAYRLLKQACKNAVFDGVLEKNPIDALKPPKRINKNPGINSIDIAERTRLIESLNSLELTSVSVAALIALYTGMRRGEVCGLQWRDLDKDNRVIWIRRAVSEGQHGHYLKSPKTDKVRDVALPDTLLGILTRWKKIQAANLANNLSRQMNDTFIIGDAIGYYSPTRLTKEWNSLVKLLGIKGAEGRPPTFHDLRHTWATMFLANGGDVKTAASNLGHANAAMTLNIYASADPDAKRRAADIVEAAIKENRR